MICEQQVQRGHRADLRFEKPANKLSLPTPHVGGCGGGVAKSGRLHSCAHTLAHARWSYEKPYEIERSMDYDEHCTVLVVIEDIPKCLFFVMKFICPCPTMYAHMDAAMVPVYGC